MAYIVQTDDTDHTGISKTVADRKRALAVAVKWASEGRLGLKISGDGPCGARTSFHFPFAFKVGYRSLLLLFAAAGTQDDGERFSPGA
jgi:hypothetical protein